MRLGSEAVLLERGPVSALEAVTAVGAALLEEIWVRPVPYHGGGFEGRACHRIRLRSAVVCAAMGLFLSFNRLQSLQDAWSSKAAGSYPQPGSGFSCGGCGVLLARRSRSAAPSPGCVSLDERHSQAACPGARRASFPSAFWVLRFLRAAWISDYVARLMPTERDAIRSVEEAAVFAFGGGHKQRAYERLILPMMVGGRRCLVQTWVVAGHLPMLLSRKTMACLGVVLNVAAKRMLVRDLNVDVGLAILPAGHLTFNALDRGTIEKTALSEPPVEAVRVFTMLAVFTNETPDLSRAATKLHTQYGDCSAARLIKVLRLQGVTDKEVFAAVMAAVTRRAACKQAATRPTRPIFVVPRAWKINDTVAVDRAEIAPLGSFVHMVDQGIRFAKAVAIPKKTTATVTRAFQCGWLVGLRSALDAAV